LRVGFMLAISFLILAQLPISGSFGFWPFCFGLWLYFVGFNYLEASLPSLVSKAVYAGGKGTALGVYSSFQFLGAFVGGAGGGLILQYWGASAVFLFCAALLLCWLVLVAGMRVPRDLLSLTVRLPAAEAAAQATLDVLRAAPGVIDLLYMADEGTVYLKVDEALFDTDILPSAGAPAE